MNLVASLMQNDPDRDSDQSQQQFRRHLDMAHALREEAIGDLLRIDEEGLALTRRLAREKAEVRRLEGVQKRKVRRAELYRQKWG